MYNTIQVFWINHTVSVPRYIQYLINTTNRKDKFFYPLINIIIRKQQTRDQADFHRSINIF